MKPKMPYQDYIRSLATKASSAGVLLFNTEGEILVLELSYKENIWGIPGGMVDADESPTQTAIRETYEEVGIKPNLSRLLCIEYKTVVNNVNTFQFVFDGGVLSDDQIATIQLDPQESLSFRFIEPITALRMLDPGISKRIEIALQARAQGVTYYLEHGQIV